MPIDLDIRDHELLGPMIREAEREAKLKGLQEGRQEGQQEGRQEGRLEGRLEGRQEGALTILRPQMEKRFGPLSKSTVEKLAALPFPALLDLTERLLSTETLEELLK